MFQPFLRFYRKALPQEDVALVVSTLLEILPISSKSAFRDGINEAVSTLLEILPLVCSVLVGF